MQERIRIAVAEDFYAIRNVDREFVGGRLNRSSQISKAIDEMRCHVMSSGSIIQGFAVCSRRSFREMDFLDLIVVDPLSRRQGVASLLIKNFQETGTTTQCWTSTNQSNTAMISLLRKLGWQESDHIEELDPGDPELFFFIHLV